MDNNPQLFLINMAIYNIIKKIAKKKNIPQKDLAEGFGVTENTMTNYLTGRTKIAADQVPMFARLLRVSISDLFEEAPLKENNPESSYDAKCKECNVKDAEIFRLKNKLFETQEKYTEAMEKLQNKKDHQKCG